jgi:hypothetical protein
MLAVEELLLGAGSDSEQHMLPVLSVHCGR